MENQINADHQNIKQVEPDQPDQLVQPSTKQKSKKLKIFLLIILMPLITIGAYFLLTLKYAQPVNKVADLPINTPSQTRADNQTNGSSYTSSLILKSRDKTTRIINPRIAPGAVEQAKLKTQTRENQLIKKIMAESSTTIVVYRINSFVPNLEQAKNIANKFGFTGNLEPANEPDQFKWIDGTRSIVVDDRTYTYIAPTTGELPTEEEAAVTATNFLKDLNLYSPDIYKTAIDRVWQDSGIPLENHPNYKDALIRVKFLKQKDDIPLIYGDLEAENSADLAVVVGGENKVNNVSDRSFGYLINETDNISANEKDVRLAVEEFEDTGGAVRWITPIAGKGWSSSGKYEIKNAVVDKIFKAYYFDNSLGTDYQNDLGLTRNTGYLLPVWIFSGTGNIYGGDYSGDQIKFESMVYAIKRLDKEVSLFKVQSLDLDRDEVRSNSTVSASFNFVYDNLQAPQYRTYRPRQGLKFKIEVAYPNDEKSEVADLIRDPNYGEVIQFNSGAQEGNLKVKVSLTDFPKVSLEKIVKVISSAINTEKEVLIGGVYISSTGKGVVCEKVILKNNATNEELSTACDDKGEFKIEGLSTGEYTIFAISKEGKILKSEPISILSSDQNLNRFNRAENYINIGIQ